MAWDKRALAALISIFVFLVPATYASDPYWDEYKFDAKGHFQLVGVTHSQSEPYDRCTFKSAQGGISGTCTYQNERESGFASGSVKWNEPPATAKEGEPYIVTSALSSHTEGVYFGYAQSGIAIDSNSGFCTSFHDIGTDFSIPRAYAQQYDEGESTKTLEYRFPTFYKPWICNPLSTSEGNPGQGGEMMRLAATKKGVYFFNMTIYAETVGGKDTYVYTYEWVPGGESGGDLSGRITDGHNDPMPYMNVTLEFLGKNYASSTDEAGNYKFSNIAGFTPDAKNPSAGVLTAWATYWRDGENYFAIFDEISQNRQLVLQKKFLLRDSSDKTQNLDFSVPAPAGVYRAKKGEPGTANLAWLKEGEEIASNSQLTNLYHMAPVYYYTANAVDFDLAILEAEIGYKLPVDIYLGGSDGTYYSRPSSSISIDIGDLAYNSQDRPRNREYHEFSHHLLFSQWNGEGLRGANDANHGGFINSDTADSYTEGFAEFMSLVIADYTNNENDPAPSHIYAGFGSLEDNLKPWERRGSMEELAVAGSLWDIYDKANDEGDTVSISIQELWPVLREKRANFLEYAKALKSAFPDKAAGIDKILLAHGFFADSYIGNGVRDQFEPFKDVNGDRNYSIGEYFVDYGINASRAAIAYDGKGEVGRATNYQRPNRGKAVEIPGAFIGVRDRSVSTYEVSIHYGKPSQGTDYSYLVDQRGGMIFVRPLPEGVDATITVRPSSAAYAAGSEYRITAAEYDRKYYAAPESAPNFDSHDFKLTPTGASEPAAPELTGGALKWGRDRGYDVESSKAGKAGAPPLGSGGLDIASALGGKLPCIPALLAAFALCFVALARK